MKKASAIFGALVLRGVELPHRTRLSLTLQMGHSKLSSHRVLDLFDSLSVGSNNGLNCAIATTNIYDLTSTNVLLCLMSLVRYVVNLSLWTMLCYLSECMYTLAVNTYIYISFIKLVCILSYM